MTPMQQALHQAKCAISHNEVPVGSVLVHNDKIIAKAHNQCISDQNPLHHAELIVISKGFYHLQTLYLNDCTLYVTLEPCPMCAAAIAQARVGKLVFGAYDPKSGGVDHGPKIFDHSHHKPEVIGGMLENECAALMTDFFKDKRECNLNP